MTRPCAGRRSQDIDDILTDRLGPSFRPEAGPAEPVRSAAHGQQKSSSASTERSSRCPELVEQRQCDGPRARHRCLRFGAFADALGRRGGGEAGGVECGDARSCCAADADIIEKVVKRVNNTGAETERGTRNHEARRHDAGGYRGFSAITDAPNSPRALLAAPAVLTRSNSAQ